MARPAVLPKLILEYLETRTTELPTGYRWYHRGVGTVIFVEEIAEKVKASVEGTRKAMRRMRDRGQLPDKFTYHNL